MAEVGSLSIPGKNGGRLRNGGTNKGGKGAVPSKIRELCRLEFSKGIPAVAKAFLDKEATHADRARALQVFGTFGLGEKTTIRQEFLDAIAPAITEFVPSENREACLARLSDVMAGL